MTQSENRINHSPAFNCIISPSYYDENILPYDAILHVMRLDEYLVTEGFISSRSRAKRYISRGLVKVDGKVAAKPAQQIKYGSVVTVEQGDLPEGYFKLKGIQERSRVIRAGDHVLDIGSSAGGFLLFASPVAGRVLGIEYSHEFDDALAGVKEECPNVEVVFGDAFNMDVSGLGEFDVILNDMTVDPAVSISILGRFLPLLRKGGRVLQVLKLGERQDPQPFIKSLEEKGLKVAQMIVPEKREAYVIASLP